MARLLHLMQENFSLPLLRMIAKRVRLQFAGKPCVGITPNPKLLF
jgi:hypothetical protein